MLGLQYLLHVVHRVVSEVLDGFAFVWQNTVKLWRRLRQREPRPREGVCIIVPQAAALDRLPEPSGSDPNQLDSNAFESN
jgi:hypothetical protein